MEELWRWFSLTLGRGSFNSLRGLRLGMPEWGSYAQKQNIYMPRWLWLSRFKLVANPLDFEPRQRDSISSSLMWVLLALGEFGPVRLLKLSYANSLILSGLYSAAVLVSFF